MSNEFLEKVARTAAFSRHFELETFRRIQQKQITGPVYLSAGQEYISATVSAMAVEAGLQPNIFIQNRGHSTYLSFGGDPQALIDELLGKASGCAKGMGGSASIHSPAINLFGHDGLMGSHVPIAVGSCYATGIPTIVFMGDAAAEEDYVLGALGWASTKRLPILFVVEDNDLSILTKKSARRNWAMENVATAFNMKAAGIPDDPEIMRSTIAKLLPNGLCSEPCLLNITTHRMFWHAGAGIDDEVFDRHKSIVSAMGQQGQVIDDEEKHRVAMIWKNA